MSTQGGDNRAKRKCILLEKQKKDRHSGQPKESVKSSFEITQLRWIGHGSLIIHSASVIMNFPPPKLLNNDDRRIVR